MDKKELLALDILSLQKLIVKHTTTVGSLEEDVKRLHGERHEAQEKLSKPLTQLEGALNLIRIESESLSVQIDAKKKELANLSRLHGIMLDDYGQTVANKQQTILSQESLIEQLQSKVGEIENTLKQKQDSIVFLAGKISESQFNLENYQKTVALISRQEKELIISLRGKVLIEKKLNLRIQELKRTHHIVVEDVLTERNKRLYLRHKQLIGMNKALDVQIERKRKQLK